MSHLPPPVPGGVAPEFGSEKVSRYTGVSQLQLRVSRYTVQLRGQKRGPKWAILGHKKFSLPSRKPSKYSEAWGPSQFQEKRSRSEKAILGALREFRGILGAALGTQNLILGMRNSILRMASHDLSNTKTTILGGTPGAILGIDGHPNERFSFAPAFSEFFFKNWGGPCAQEIWTLEVFLSFFLPLLDTHCPTTGGMEGDFRAALKGTNLRGQMPICGFLRVPAKICCFLRQPAVFCENLRFPNALFSRKRRESAKISENLRQSAFGLGLSP